MPSSQDTSRADRALSHREMYGHDGTSRCRAAWHRAHLSQELRGAGHRVPMPHDPSRWGSHAMAAVAAPPMMRLTPRPYQYEAVAALLAAAARGVQRPLLVLPTGTGKTIIFALLVQRRGGRALILGVCLPNCAPRRPDQGLWDRELRRPSRVCGNRCVTRTKRAPSARFA